ncbi:MAG: hypothetical protein M1840_005442 [Geoglossum simile]|nr:MAG: hypothetical protein M1840_005442 [Geoglossum simile]
MRDNGPTILIQFSKRDLGAKVNFESKTILDRRESNKGNTLNTLSLSRASLTGMLALVIVLSATDVGVDGEFDMSHPADGSRLNVAELDRGVGSFPEKIRTAFNILRLDESTSQHKIQEPRCVEAPFSAKEEAILRWLLAALEGSRYPDSNARLDPRSWYLINYLIQRIPIANAALLLSTHNFLHVLDSTLCDAADEKRFGPGAGKVAAQEEEIDQRRCTGCGSSSGVSESSAAIMENPSVPASSPRKRKRRSPSVERHRMPARYQRGGSGIISLFSSILMTIDRILSTASDPESRSKGPTTTHCSQAHMKAVIRGKPDVASRIMGNWFKIIGMVISSSEENPDRCGIRTNDSCLTPIIQIWQSRYLESGDNPDLASKAFSAHCLIPALLLLSKLASIPGEGNIATDGVRSIESLLAHHILLPARVSFFDSYATSSDVTRKETDLQTPSLLGVLLEPLWHEASGTYRTLGLSNPNDGLRAAIFEAAPLLFEIAIKCLTGTRGKRRGIDTGWIENVLCTLARSVGLILSPSIATSTQSAQIDMLEQMLQIAIQNEISLSSEVLDSMVASCSRLTMGRVEDIRWTLLEKISRLNEDLFYPSDGEIPTFKGANSKPPNSFFTQITNLVISKSSEGDIIANYNIAKTILMRLVPAIARAHNLAGFISHWQRELGVAERRRLNTGTGGALGAIGLSVWEDEDLIVEVGCQLIRFLTLQEIKEILVSSELNIRQSIEGALDPERDIKSFISLVTLDTVFSGPKHDGNAFLNITPENIRPVYCSLLRLASSSTSCLISHRWRTWRIMSRIQELWQAAGAAAPSTSISDPHFPSSIPKLTDADAHPLLQAAIETACSSLRKTLSNVKQSNESPQRLPEALLAFDFILYTVQAQGSVAASQTEGGTKVPIVDILNRIVEFLSLCLSRSGTIAGQEVPVWNGRLEGLTGELSFGVALATRLMIHRLGVLLQAPPTTRKRLFVLLHGLASWNCRDREQRARQTHQLSFVRTWDGMLSNENFLLHADPKDEVVEILAEFLDAGKSCIFDLDVEDRDSRALAVSNLMKLPLELFQREQRERVLDILLKNLLHSQTKSKISDDSLIGHISLMLKLMDAPNASATLATDPKALWELSEIIGQSSPNPAILAFCGFRDIVRKNLGHLLLTKDQERSHQYLLSMSKSLRDYLTTTPSLGSRLGPLQLVRSSLAVLWANLEALSGDIVGVLRSSRGKYLQLLLSDLRVRSQELELGGRCTSVPFTIEALIDTVIELPGLGITVSDDEVRAILRTIGATVSPLFPYLPQVVDDSEEELSSNAKLSTVSTPSKSTHFDRSREETTYTAWLGVYLLKMDKRAARLSDGHLTGKPRITHPDGKLILSTFRSFAKTLGQADKLALLVYLGEVISEGNGFTRECGILLLRSLLISEGKPSKTLIWDLS